MTIIIITITFLLCGLGVGISIWSIIRTRNKFYLIHRKEKALIKNIIYLDVDKMYSLSSQIFEGVTEYILKEKTRETENGEEQKGPVGSGRILGDILRKQERTSEKKFLSDHSYAIFEDRLLEDDRVTLVHNGRVQEDKKIFRGNTFIRVKSTVAFNDMQVIQNTIDNFNKIGLAFANVSNFATLKKIKDELALKRKDIRDKNELARFDAQVKNLTNVNSIAKNEGLQQDEKFLASLSTILHYGFQDQFEVQMKGEDFLFSANLKRESLREKEDLLIRKYSRNSEVEFVLFGVITQSSENNTYSDGLPSEPNMKQALMNLVGMLSNLEGNFTGRLSNEIIIDPIALYTEIE